MSLQQQLIVLIVFLSLGLHPSPLGHSSFSTRGLYPSPLGLSSFSTWAFSLYLASFRILIRNSVQKMLDLPFSISKRKHPRLHQFSASVFLSYFSKIESFSFGYPLNLPFQLVEHLHNVMLSFHKCCLLPSTIFWVSVCNWNCFC